MTWLRPLQMGGVSSVISTRTGPHGEKNFNVATHVGDQTNVIRHRAEIKRALEVSHVQWLEQVHGSDVLYINRVSEAARVCDAVWTDQVGVGLAIMTADCVPVLLADATGRLVGAAHAGWQGIEAEVISALVDAMPVNAKDLFAVVGPSISQKHYEVGEEVWSRFPERYIRKHEAPSKRYLDLAGMVRAELRSCGIKSIDVVAECVFANDVYFSHRASQQQARPEGRFVSAIGLLL